ncbi:MAG: hypothetical protein K8T91_01665 [Planctomycetes bacterium]|nr:hypothetical protein [Planctomycetota bacterium]
MLKKRASKIKQVVYSWLNSFRQSLHIYEQNNLDEWQQWGMRRALREVSPADLLAARIKTVDTGEESADDSPAVKVGPVAEQRRSAA